MDHSAVLVIVLVFVTSWPGQELNCTKWNPQQTRGSHKILNNRRLNSCKLLQYRQKAVLCGPIDQRGLSLQCIEKLHSHSFHTPELSESKRNVLSLMAQSKGAEVSASDIIRCPQRSGNSLFWVRPKTMKFLTFVSNDPLD